MHGQARRREQVLLTGDWAPAWVSAIADQYEVRPAGDSPPSTPVDWLLIGPGADPCLLRRLHVALSRTRTAASDGAPLPWRDCDVRIPAAAEAVDVVAALRLAEQGFAVGGRPPRTAPAPVHRLTGREIELLDVLGRGLGNDQIARAMSISRRTVEFHLTRIFRKFGVASRMEAVVHARRIGVIG